MEFICSNEKHNRGNKQLGILFVRVNFFLPFRHILCYVNRPPSDILIPRNTRKDNEQNETK